VDDPEQFHLITKWGTDQDYDSYLGSEQFRILIGALKVLSEETEVRYSMGSRKMDKKVLEVSGNGRFRDYENGSLYTRKEFQIVSNQP
jgi:hypothetical protein